MVVVQPDEGVFVLLSVGEVRVCVGLWSGCGRWCGVIVCVSVCLHRSGQHSPKGTREGREEEEEEKLTPAKSSQAEGTQALITIIAAKIYRDILPAVVSSLSW